ncbi:MAG: glycosyltransferase family 4 protein, partial [Sphaerospermopsis kisseleviana]
MDYRKAYGLPERYFLSLGRMVEKKNLATLVAAYAKFCDENRNEAEIAEGNRVAGDERGPGGVVAPPQAEGTGDRGQSEAVTRDKDGRCSDLSPQTPVLATRYSVPALVFVGSGELEGALREQARSLGLRVVERTDCKVNGLAEGASPRVENLKGGKAETTDGGDAAATKTRDSFAYGPSSQTPVPATGHEENCGTVFFYGFRQIEENPVFYALAEAFVLPSLKEEWGLVVNEAMACSLPVIVSRTAGCAEDLLPGGEQVAGGEWRVTSKDADDRKPLTDDLLGERSNGFVFDPESVDALSEALWRVAVAGERLKVKGNNLEEMGKRSREIVGQFSCENF